MAVVDCRAADVDESELKAHCRSLIADYKIPKRIELRREALPRSAAGKVLKRELREPFWTGRSRRIGTE